MNNLNKDEIIYLALKLDLPDILSLSLSNRIFNNVICKNKIFWMQKLIHDYKIYNLPKNHTYKNYYKHINTEYKRIEYAKKKHMYIKVLTYCGYLLLIGAPRNWSRNNYIFVPKYRLAGKQEYVENKLRNMGVTKDEIDVALANSYTNTSYKNSLRKQFNEELDDYRNYKKHKF